jgi:hypothetical protein
MSTHRVLVREAEGRRKRKDLDVDPSIHPMALTAHIGPRPPLARFRNLTPIDSW